MHNCEGVTLAIMHLILYTNNIQLCFFAIDAFCLLFKPSLYLCVPTSKIQRNLGARKLNLLPSCCNPTFWRMKMVRLSRCHKPAVRKIRWCGFAAFSRFQRIMWYSSSASVYASGGIPQNNPVYNVLIF